MKSLCRFTFVQNKCKHFNEFFGKLIAAVWEADTLCDKDQ